MPPQSSRHRLGYRPGLDGVRAVAVLGVAAFHFGAPWLPGGFIGVDVFLVLSGFLITALLLAEHRDTGRLDLPAFWARRARRLLPALLVLLSALASWAALAAPPEIASGLRADGLAALLYVANWWFVATGESYLATTEPSLLLHTWSLGVEEQWYLLLPLLLLGLLRLRRGSACIATAVAAVAAGLAVVSIAVMAALSAAGAAHARLYYGTDTRMAALLLGAAMAAVVHRRGLPHRRWADAAGLAGLAGLTAAATTATARDPVLFRGGLALVAVAALGLVLAAATPGTLTARALSWRPLVAVGVISYGLYLWHWPIHLLLAEHPWWVRLAVAVGAAAASYVLVERPIRRGAWSGLPGALRPLVPAVAVSGVAVLLVAATAGAPPPPRGEIGETVQVLPRAASPEATPAPAPPRTPAPPRAPAVPPAEESAPPPPVRGELDVVVVGDSVGFSLAWHAPDRASGLRVTGEHVLGCGLTDEPLVFAGGGVLERPHCDGYVEGWPALLEEHDPDVVLLVAGAWEVYDVRAAGEVLAVGTPAHDVLLANRVRTALDLLTAGGRPVALTDLPCFDVSDPWDPRGEVLRVGHVSGLFRRIALDYPTARALGMADHLCPDGVGLGGRSARYDGVHFTAEGAADLWDWLEDELRRTASLGTAP